MNTHSLVKSLASTLFFGFLCWLCFRATFRCLVTERALVAFSTLPTDEITADGEFHLALAGRRRDALWPLAA